MATAVTMPQLGESVVEGTVSRWLKAVGSRVEKLEPLLEIATDKIDTEIPSPACGILLRILVNEGDTVAAGTILAYIGMPDTRDSEESVTAQTTPAPSAAGGHADPHTSVAEFASASSAGPTGRNFISPVVARMATEHDLDLTQVMGTGLGGRITKKDVLAHLATDQSALRRKADAEAVATSTSDPARPARRDEILHPLTTMRRAIAQHMAVSKQTSPHVTTIIEADMTAVVRHREAHKREFGVKGIALTYMPYFVTAVAVGLKTVSIVNSRFSEQGIVESRRIHIGMAVAVKDGLLVPVIRDADERNLQGMARAVNDVARRARANQLSPDELAGGTFTITNHGTGGSLVATPIIHQPQAAILGVGAMVKRPVVRSSSASLLPSADDAIVIRPMCYLSLTFDHRVLDGAQADAFLRVLRDTLENWTD
ncbi:MAG: 2-oxo acid dehydrogenase subunit E2 [Caldilineaceae bacterium]|nr:2-oxo acid dehydrogenase subunit E2 [Caldilineaceae bacterium]